jgi:hypothetical protein
MRSRMVILVCGMQRQEHKIYGAKDITFKVLLARYQVREFHNDTKVTDETLLYRNGFDLEVEDTVGTYRCGKVTSKEKKTMSSSEQAMQLPKKFYRVLFGLISMKGVTEAGKKASVENLPCMLRAGGRSLMPWIDYLDDVQGRWG